MSFTVHVMPSGREFTVEGDETILDGALQFYEDFLFHYSAYL